MKKLFIIVVVIAMLTTISTAVFAAENEVVDLQSITDVQQTEYMLGDVNGNGAIDAMDYVFLKRAYFGTYDFDEEVKSCADINENAEIDAMDYVLLKRAYFGTYELDKQDGNNESSTILIENCMPSYSSYDFDSYEEIKLALTKASSVIYSDLRTAKLSYRDVYKQTIEAYETKKIKLFGPKFNGDLVKLCNLDGFSNITFFSSELYKLPWIWYDCSIDGYDLRVRVSNVSIIDNKELRAADSYRNVLSLIAPDAPSPSNYKDYESYSSIYEKDIVLSGGQSVKAMISELKESSNIYVMIYKDDVLAMLYADAELFTDSFWESFDIAPY